MPWLRPAVLVVASVLVLGAALVTADDAAKRVTEAATDEAARSAETTVRASVDPLLADADDGRPRRVRRPADRRAPRAPRPARRHRADQALVAVGHRAVLGPARACAASRSTSTRTCPPPSRATRRAPCTSARPTPRRTCSTSGLPGDFLEIYLPGPRVERHDDRRLRDLRGRVLDHRPHRRHPARRVHRRGPRGDDPAADAVGRVQRDVAHAATRQNGRLVELASDLRGREARFRSLLQNSSDAQAILDADGRVRYESVAVERILGCRGRGLGGPAVRLARPRRGPLDRRAGAGRSRVGARRRAPLRVPDPARRRHVADDGGDRAQPARRSRRSAGIVINHRDITERKVLEAQLTRQAFHDALTGLPNRALFTDRVSHALKRRGRQHRGRRRPVRGPRRLQGDQRQPRAPGGRPRAPGGRRAAAHDGPPGRHGRPPRRRRVRLPARGRVRSRGRRGGRRAGRDLAGRAAGRRRRRGRAAGERRHRGRRGRRHGGGPAARRGHGDVHREGARRRLARALRAGDARGGDHALRAGHRPAARDRPPGVRPPLPAGRRPAARAGSSASRRSCAGSTRRAGCCRRPGSSPPPRRRG